jgi:hypothetical protein
LPSALARKETKAIRSEMIMNKYDELTDEQRQAVEPILPKRPGTTACQAKATAAG